jgi:small subunit ribosomal protein S21|tara:strand:- start:508 stop:711 length:204 start_codon:yes stop_codon:yes gene_type:complete
MSITVVVKNNNVEKAIRQLKKKLMREGVVRELKTRQYYEKPSEKKLRLKKENIKRVLKNKKIREREQ